MRDVVRDKTEFGDSLTHSLKHERPDEDAVIDDGLHSSTRDDTNLPIQIDVIRDDDQ